MELQGTVALITGGSGVLGGRICHALARNGVNLAVGYATSADRARSMAEECARDHGVRAIAVPCDVTNAEQVHAAVESTLSEFGRIDILVNDGAYNKFIPFNDLDSMTMDEWHKILTINLTGPMLTIKAVAGPMKKQGRGRIVNISSTAGFGPTGSSIAYAVSKAGLNHLTRCMAVGLAPEITVNCVAPGYLEGTKMSSNLSPEMRQRGVESSVLKRAADLNDIAEQVVTFCRSDTTTGQNLVIDSGRVFQ